MYAVNDAVSGPWDVNRICTQYNRRTYFNFDMQFPVMHSTETNLLLVEAATRWPSDFGTIDVASCIKKAIDSLKRMNIIDELNVCNNGTRYKIDYKVYNNIILDLNNEYNPIERLRIADNFRGKEHELHNKMIENYKETVFDNRRI